MMSLTDQKWYAPKPETTEPETPINRSGQNAGFRQAGIDQLVPRVGSGRIGNRRFHCEPSRDPRNAETSRYRFAEPKPALAECQIAR